VQWNWDSAIVAAGWAVFDEKRAWEELETLFSDQWKDGMVASINFHKFSKTYFPGPEIWGTPENPSKTSGISQPPVAALSARFMYEHTAQEHTANPVEAKQKIEDLFPKMLAWHRWWYKVGTLLGFFSLALQSFCTWILFSPNFSKAHTAAALTKNDFGQ
jgi:hypothetical protein